MKKLNTVLSSLALAAVFGLSMSSCSSTTAPGTSSPPTGVMVAQLTTGLGVTWTGDGVTDTVVALTSAGSISASASGTSSATLIGLTAGVPYTILVRSSNGSSGSITWDPSIRKDGIKVFQYSSTGLSGLSLASQAAISLQNANKGSIDFLLDDSKRDPTITNPSGLSFEGAQTFDNTWRASYVDADDHYVVGGLNADYSATGYAAAATEMQTVRGNDYPIPDDAVYATKGSRVLLVATNDGNFAKIEIVPDAATGKLYSMSGTDKYITVNVSYQPTPLQPYASRPHRTPGVKERRVSVQ